MITRKLILLFILVVLLNACGPTTNQTSTAAIDMTPTSGTMPCMVVAHPMDDSLRAALLQNGGHIIGREQALVIIVVYSDYQCKTCATLNASITQILSSHPDEVLLVFRYFPMPEHDKSAPAIQAVEAANFQGKFWEMHNLLFEKLNEWDALDPESFPAWAVNQAANLGMDSAQFQFDFQNEDVISTSQQAIQFVAGIQPPTVFPIMLINDVSPYTGFIDFANLDLIVRAALLSTRQYTECPPRDIDPFKQYIARLETMHGEIVIQLYPDKAPLAVNNFLFLARNGWFNNITWHRVIPGFVAQTGDPSGTGLGNPGYYFATEFVRGHSFDQAGVVAMANQGIDTNGSQFFITYAPLPKLNNQYTIIGQVILGMETLEKLTERGDPQPGVILPPGDSLISVDVEER